MTITEALRAHLINNTTLVGSRIYPKTIPQGATMPIQVYHVIPGGEKVHSMGDDSGLTKILIQLDHWSEDYSAAEVAAAETKTALRNYSKGDPTQLMGNAGGVWVQTVLIDDENDDFFPETKLYVYRVFISIWYMDA